MSELISEMIVILSMLFINAVCAAYEIALASISRSKIETLNKRKTFGAAAALYMKDHMEGSLALVQLAITLAGAVAAATGGASVGEYLVPYLEHEFALTNATAEILGICFLVIPLSIFTIIFSELVPKMLAIENNAIITLGLSPLMRILYRISYPLVAFFEKVVRALIKILRKYFKPAPAADKEDELDELWAAMAYAKSRNIIGSFEERVANSAILFSRKTVADALVSADMVSCIQADASLPDALIRAHMDMHTRFPIIEKEGDWQTVTGYINFKDIVTALRINPGDPTVRGITRPIKHVDMRTPVSQALQEMMAENAHMAIVTEGKEVRGIVTLEDIIEMLVGKIADEYDRLPSYIHTSGTSHMVGGGTPVSSVRKTLGLDDRDVKIPLSQWVREKLGRDARGGDIIKDSGMEVWVRKTRRHHVMEAIIMRTED